VRPNAKEEVAMRVLALLRVVLAAVVLLTLSGGIAAAQNETAEAAISVSAANPTQTGTLVGSRGGTFRYYRFFYPGADAEVRLHLSWNPGWSATDAAFNFNLYAPDGTIRWGERGDDAGPANTANFKLTTKLAGEYLVQVYNYTDGKAVAFTLDFFGLGESPVRVTENTNPSQALGIEEKFLSVTGSVTGQSSGAFNYYTFEYPGVDWETRINLTFRPGRWLNDDSFGFYLFDGEDWVAAGSEAQRTDEWVSKSLTFRRFQPGTIGIQVYNYVDGVQGEYTLTVDGAVGAVVSAAGNDSPQWAVELTPTIGEARGRFPSQDGASFHYYGLNYQGGNEPITMALSFRPQRGVTGDGIGINVYRGADLVATSQLADGRNAGESLAYLTWRADQPGYYGVQVFNYARNVRSSTASTA
jgi:hypothetical protein